MFKNSSSICDIFFAIDDVNHSGFYCSNFMMMIDDSVAVASAEPYGDHWHLAADR